MTSLLPAQPPVGSNEELQLALIGIGRFAMAESVARQVGRRPLEVIRTMERYIDPAQGVNEVTMAMIVDKTVDHIRSGKALL